MMKMISSVLSWSVSVAQLLKVKLAFVGALISFFVLIGYVSGFNLSANALDLYEKQTKGQPEPYDMVQEPQVGANNYNDDAKYDTKGAKADAQRLVERAEQNLQRKAQNPGEIVGNLQKENPLGEKAKQSSERIGEGADEIKKGFFEGRRRGVRNIKENVDQAKRNVPRVVDEAKQNALGANRDPQGDYRKVGAETNDSSRGFENAQGAKGEVGEGANDVSRGLQKLVDRASDMVK